MPALERNCTGDCRETYLGGHTDWVDVVTVIGTSPDQFAVAPGSLVREWRGDGGRRYFEYRLPIPRSISTRSFRPATKWPAKTGMESNLRCITSKTTLRIIEFPRVASFAQAFPGTMPYSESIGFIANLHHPEDIDLVFYVVAHEMAHQWWAHQVIGANMEGATLLSETLAQYSVLMVMEKEYGHDIMRKFLKYEIDRYLRSRGRERLKERPLLTVEAKQGYIHYRKGSVVMYYLKEMIGEDAVNRALRNLIRQQAYAPSALGRSDPSALD